MTEDVGARTVLEVVDVLARRLGLAVDRRRVAASGDWQGVGVRVEATAGPHLPGSRLRVVVELPTDTDLDVVVVRRSESHLRSWPHVGRDRPTIHTGVAALGDQLGIRGEAEPPRVAAWLRPPEVIERIRDLDDVEGLVIDRMAVRAFLDEAASPDRHEVVVERLRALALALDASRAAVPPSRESAPWLTTFEDLARTLGLRVETCPLAALGRVDELDVRIAVPGWGPFRDGVVLVDVSRPGPESRPWDLPQPGDAPARRLARRVLRTALRVAARVGAGEAPLRRLLARVRARPPLGLPPGFAVASARDHRIVAATRLAPGCDVDLALAVERLSEALHAGPGHRGGPAPSPYR